MQRGSISRRILTPRCQAATRALAYRASVIIQKPMSISTVLLLDVGQDVGATVLEDRVAQPLLRREGLGQPPGGVPKRAVNANTA